jgi:hypothetical protein
VGVGHRLRHLLEDRQGSGKLGTRISPLAEQGGQGPPLDQLHREIRPAVRDCPQLEDRDDSGVLQLAAYLRLLDEPAYDLGIPLVRFQKDLDREVTAQIHVTPLEDRPHVAADIPARMS